MASVLDSVVRRPASRASSEETIQIGDLRLYTGPEESSAPIETVCTLKEISLKSQRKIGPSKFYAAVSPEIVEAKLRADNQLLKKTQILCMNDRLS